MIYILFPAYNEGKNLPLVLREMSKVLKGLPHKFIIVDDASQDGTASTIKRSNGFKVQLLKHKFNQGPGAAFDTGFRWILKHAKTDDLVITAESDETSDPKILAKMFKKLDSNGIDVVIAGCFAPGGNLGRVPWYREVFSRIANTILQIVFPISRIYTYSSFYRAYTIKSLERVYQKYGNDTITDKGFFSVVELLIKLSMIPGIKMAEVPMVLDWGPGKRKSGMKVGKTIKAYLKYILKYKFYGVK